MRHHSRAPVRRGGRWNANSTFLLGARTPSGAHVLSHQSGLFVLKDVAMIHERVVARCRLIESDEKLHFVLNKHHILPAHEMRRRRRSPDGQNAKQRAVDMKWMCHSSRAYL